MSVEFIHYAEEDAMVKKLCLVWISMLFLTVSIWAQNTPSSTGNGDKQEVREFKVIDGDLLDLEQLKSINNSPDNNTQPGFATVVVKFEKGIKSPASWLPNYPQAGQDTFFHAIQTIVNTWNYTDSIETNGEIFYTIATNGTIRIDLKSLSLTDYERTKFSTGELLVKSKGFEKQNIRAIMKKGQLYGAKEPSFVQKLGIPYAWAFTIMAILFFVTTFMTFRTIRNKVEFKESKIKETVTTIWMMSSLKLEIEKSDASGYNKIITERSLNSDNPDTEDEIGFIKQLVDAIEPKNEKDGKKPGKLDLKNAQLLGDNRPEINYEKLADGLSKLVKSAKTEEEKREAVGKVESLIWNDYSSLFVQKAKDICLKNKEYRISRVFLAGLENHLNNRNAWYTSSEIDRAIDKTAASELEQMKGFIDWIWVIASIAPMVGLFGTVTGISKAFAEISQSSAGMEQSELITRLAGGINEALYTTIVGLIIGMSATLVYYFIKATLDSVSSKWEQLFVDITNNF